MPETRSAAGRDRTRRVAASGDGACVGTADGRWLLDATTADDRVILGYGWDPLCAIPGWAGLRLSPPLTSTSEQLEVIAEHLAAALDHARAETAHGGR